jgi:hypothetical protein
MRVASGGGDSSSAALAERGACVLERKPELVTTLVHVTGSSELRT